MNPTCVICQYQCENQWGNNPAPIVSMAYGVCCNSCNWDFVTLHEALGERLGEEE
jgi:hypothetical protein